MADRTQRRMIEREELARDPFAELTKIIGFDPRVPVRPTAASAQPAAGGQDDFGIDLERELMGDLDDMPPAAPSAAEDPASTPNPAEPPVAASAAAFGPASTAEPSPPPADDSFEAAFARALRGDAAAIEAQATGAEGPQEPVQVADLAEAQVTAEPALEDFEAAFVESDVGEREAAGPQFEAAAPPEELLGDFDQAFAASEPAADEAALSSEPVLDEGFDAVFAASLERDLASLDDAWLAADTDAQEMQPEAAEAYEPEFEFDAEVSEQLAEASADEWLPGEAVSEPEPPQATGQLEPVDVIEQAFAHALAEVEVGLDRSAQADLAWPASAGRHDGDSVRQPEWGEGEYDPGEPVPAAEILEIEEPEFRAYPAGEFADDWKPRHAGEGEASGPDAGYEADALIIDADYEAMEAEPAAEVAATEIQVDAGDAPLAHAAEILETGEPAFPAYNAAHFAEEWTLRPAHEDEASVADADHEAGALTIDIEDEALDAPPVAEAAGTAVEEPPPAQAEALPAGGAPAAPVREASVPDPVAPLLDDDPFAALAAMAAQYRASREAAPRPATAFSAYAAFNAQPASAGTGEPMQQHKPEYHRYEDVPDIETVEVPEGTVAVADDLDLPEVPYGEDAPEAVAYDDLDAEFADLLKDMASAEPVRRHVAPAEMGGGFGQDPVDPQPEPAAYHPVADAGHAAFSRTPAEDLFQPEAGYDGDFAATDRVAAAAPEGSEWSESGYIGESQFAYDADGDEEVGSEPAHAASRPARRGLLAAAVVGGVAVLGGIAAVALSFGGGDLSGGPAIVRADDGPVKIRPENPGGTTVPNQDSTVYERVAGELPAAPVQERLVTAVEEPVEIPALEPEPVALGEPADEVLAATGLEAEAAAGAETAEDGNSETAGRLVPSEDAAELADARGDLPGVDDMTAEPAAPLTAKSEDRIEQTITEAEGEIAPEMVAVAPRRVRTMIVKPDGSLVPREEADPQPAAVEPQPAGVEAAALEPAADAAGQTPAATPASTGALTLPAENVAAPSAADAATTAAVQTMPAKVAVAPVRPAEQPVDVVGEVKADQVAALAAPAEGAWSMQIASQPTEASARASYADLARRYSGVLEGRGANIVKAEIAGKGTYYRVRVPAASRNEAVQLCTRYKAAGGNCFVSK